MKPIPLYHVWSYTDVDRKFWDDHLQDWLPRRIFDAHIHMADPVFRTRPVTEAMRWQYWVNEVLEPIDADTLVHCVETVFPGREVQLLAFALPGLDWDIDAANEYVRTRCLARGWRCLAVICPDWSAKELAERLDKPGVCGVKPYYSLIGYDPDSRDEYLEADIFDFLPHHQLELLNERRSWVTLHVPKADRLGHPRNIAEIKDIREKYPDVKLVIAHLGRCYTAPHAEEAFPHFTNDPGLYFDISAVLNPEVHKLALEILGSRRLLYGTDNPVFYMRGRRHWQGRTYINHTNYSFYFNNNRESPEIEAGYTLYMYEALKAIKQACDETKIDQKDVEAIFYKNAAYLLSENGSRFRRNLGQL